MKRWKTFLVRELHYDLYAEAFEENLAEILQHNLAKDLAEDEAQELAHRWERSEPDAEKKVNALLTANGMYMDFILNQAKRSRAKKLAEALVRRETRFATGWACPYFPIEPYRKRWKRSRTKLPGPAPARVKLIANS
jgi:hypothetical protein